jgi:hypothetical protein
MNAAVKASEMAIRVERRRMVMLIQQTSRGGGSQDSAILRSCIAIIDTPTPNQSMLRCTVGEEIEEWGAGGFRAVRSSV